MREGDEPVRRPEDLLAWQLCNAIGDYVAEVVVKGAASRNRRFCDQILRSSSAPAPQIAEGFGRWTPRDWANYYRMAVSSLMETQTHLAYGLRRKYYTPAIHSNAATKCGRALLITKRLLASKLRQIAEEENRKKAARRKEGPRDPPRPDNEDIP